MQQTMTRRYYLEFGGSMAAYTVAVFGATTALNDLGVHNPWRLLVAVVPVLPAIGAMAAFIRFLRTRDELQRRIQFEALGTAFAATILITFTYGWLEVAGLPAVSSIWIAPLMIVLWGVCSGIATRRFA